MYDFLILALIFAATVTAAAYIHRQFRQLPAIYRRGSPHPTVSDRMLTNRMQWLFVILFSIAISTLAISIYTALRPIGAGPEQTSLATKIDTTRLKVEATESKVDQTKSQIANAQSAIARIEQMMATGAPQPTVKQRVDINSFGATLLGFLVLGLVLLLVGFIVDYARARPASSPNTVTRSSAWANLLQGAATFKIAGSLCLIGSVSFAFKFDKIFSFETTQPPAEMHVALQYFVDQVASTPPVNLVPPPGPETPPDPKPVQPTDPDPRTPTIPVSTEPVQSADIDCGQPSEPDRLVFRTFALGKNNEFEGMDKSATEKAIQARLDEILNDIEEGTKKRKLQGLVFVGSADKRVLGKISREQYGSNSVLAKSRAEFLRDLFRAQLKLRHSMAQPNWVLVLNPDVPQVRLTVDDGKQFDALRAVQVCVAWTKNDSREASRR